MSKMASQHTYTLHINETQLATISNACEVLARLGMGQFRDALECLPLREFAPDGWHEDMEGIAHILKKHMKQTYGAYSASSDTSKTAWDLYQVARNRLAWDENPNGGFGVSFDQPMKTGPDPLAFVENK